MKKLTIKVLLTLAIMFSLVCGLNAQFLNGFYNGAMPIQHTSNPKTNPFRGNLIPNTTEWDGPNPSPTYAYFPILIVFVQFEDDPEYSPFGSWPLGQAPIYMDSMIATNKNISTTTPWWEKYNPNTEMISSQWMEISRGKFHVISPGVNGKGAFFVKLDSAYKYADLDTGENYMNKVIWQKLWEKGLKDWRPYDRWSYNPADSLFYYEGDGKVDFIYKIHRARGRGAMPNYDGYAALSSRGGYGLVDTVHNIIADYGLSGFTLSFRGLKSQYIGSSGHEHGHFMTMMNHIQNGRVSYGIGFDGFFSPYEMILNEYMTPRTATFGTPNSLGDYSSRNNNAEGKILKVPIDNNTDECFLIANRRKISKWDRVMVGDTVQIEPYNDYSELGKGIYIYHIKNGVHFPVLTNDTVQDLECADGYWEWEYKNNLGRAKVAFDCFISGPGWRVYQKKNVLYTNDPSTLGQPYGQVNLGNPNPFGDDVSFFYRYNDTPRVSQWTIGDEIYSGCELGTDRINTNEEEILFYNNRAGDRWDAWNVGYNEIFSPYSSPSTVKWNNEPSGIFIWYYNLNGNTASIIVERAEEYGGDKPLQEILAETPPSRPMGIKDTYVPDNTLEDIFHPKISWNHNMEPDMVRDNGKKMYIVYRALADNMNQLPGPYYVRAALEIDTNAPAEYVDLQIIGEPSNLLGQEGYEPFPLRYRVVAVDKHNDYSVPSDFATAIGLKPEGSSIDPGSGDKISSNNGLPKEYNLFQNYPNPFNPVTNIQFDLPKEGLITLKVYDVLGREVKSLINEFKQAGSYIVSFDGSEISSGIYFYRLEAGNFVQVKRMVLIK